MADIDGSLSLHHRVRLGGEGHSSELADLPVRVERDRTLRVKVIDTCGMACTFCHNEGTPVVADNLGRDPRDFDAAAQSGRVSIYLASNGARFLPAAVSPDEEFVDALRTLRDALHVDELHLIGGEPSLHPRLAEVIRSATGAGFRVCMTSNGENGARILAGCAREGLDRVNFSIFGTTASELAQVQHARFADRRRAEKKIQALRHAVQAALAAGIRVSANIVVPNYSHASRVRRLLTDFAPGLSVRLLNSLDDGIDSVIAIERILAEAGATAFEHRVTAGVSGWRTAYRTSAGRELLFKKIRRVRLPKTCLGCQFNNTKDCEEGFYGVRLYRDRRGGYQVGVCIQRMDLCMPVSEFVQSPLCQEVVALRDAEYGQFSTCDPFP
ncbi:radical SAM protein [Actinoplanes sp. NPDC000266]